MKTGNQMDQIENPIDYQFREQYAAFLYDEHLCRHTLDLAATLNLVALWGPTIQARLNGLEREIFRDVLSEIAELLERINRDVFNND
jgi:hypothetical protein